MSGWKSEARADHASTTNVPIQDFKFDWNFNILTEIFTLPEQDQSVQGDVENLQF